MWEALYKTNFEKKKHANNNYLLLPLLFFLRAQQHADDSQRVPHQQGTVRSLNVVVQQQRLDQVSLCEGKIWSGFLSPQTSTEDCCWWDGLCRSCSTREVRRPERRTNEPWRWKKILWWWEERWSDARNIWFALAPHTWRVWFCRFEVNIFSFLAKWIFLRFVHKYCICAQVTHLCTSNAFVKKYWI